MGKGTVGLVCGLVLGLVVGAAVTSEAKDEIDLSDVFARDGQGRLVMREGLVVEGDVLVRRAATIDGDVQLGRSLLVKGDLKAERKATVRQLHVSGNDSLVRGTITFERDVRMRRDVEIERLLGVSKLQVDTAMRSSGPADFQRNVQIDGNLKLHGKLQHR